MSLKKQVKEMKGEVQKKEDEIDMMKKNIKISKVHEMETEVKTYKEECLRLRRLIDDMMKQGSSHPVYQLQAQDQLK